MQATRFASSALIWALIFATTPVTPGQRGSTVPPKEVLEQLIERCDLDQNGRLDAKERERLRELMQRQGHDGAQGLLRALPFVERRKVVERFDDNGNGRLETTERSRARRWLESQQARLRPEQLPAQGPPSKETNGASPRRLGPDDVPHHPDAGLYDTNVLRTIFLTFQKKDWFEELSTFYLTDVEVPANLMVDGRTYPDVGVRFRGRASFLTSPGRKKSLRVRLDFVHRKQDVQGYETLNLLNAHDDPSMLREVVHSQICREYGPAAKANLVRLVINGESFGVYVNVQQIDKKFVDQWFGTTDGKRWKVPASFDGRGALTWLGEDVRRYKSAYQLKTGGKGKKKAWRALMRLCRILEKTPTSELADTLPEVLDIEHALWFLAIENVFMDGDGYASSGGDYYLYMDPKERFHPIPYDNDATFRSRAPRDGVAHRRDRLQNHRGPHLSPLERAEARPLISRMLDVPEWRARYLAYVRTLVDTWLDWRELGPLFDRHRKLIEEEVKRDDKSAHGHDAFVRCFEGVESEFSLKAFVTARRAFLKAHPAIAADAPVIESVEHQEVPAADGRRALVIRARIGKKVAVGKVLLHYGRGARGPYRTLPMFDDGKHGDGAADDGVYGASSPALRPGKRVRYFVEARRATGSVSSFRPARAGAGAVIHRFR